MTKADLVEKVTRLGDLTRRDGEVIVETIFGSVIGALQSGDKIEIRGFGLPHPPAQPPHRTQSQDRRARRSPRQARSLLQAIQGTPRPGQPRRSLPCGLEACARTQTHAKMGSGMS